jgi:hypothetical protein
MSNCPFCNCDIREESGPPRPSAGKRPIGFLGRARRSIQWLLPAAILMLMPKCPLCVAGYVALFTGLGITVLTARWIQFLVRLFCLTALAYLAIAHWRSRSVASGDLA